MSWGLLEDDVDQPAPLGRAEQLLVAAGVSPQARGESLTVAQFAAIAGAAKLSLPGGKLSPSDAQPEEVDS